MLVKVLITVAQLAEEFQMPSEAQYIDVYSNNVEESWENQFAKWISTKPQDGLISIKKSDLQVQTKRHISKKFGTTCR